MGLVLITGAAGGVGAALLRAFQAAGWQALAATRADADVRDASRVEALFDRAEAMGGAEALVCAAGVAHPRAPAWEIPPSDAEEAFAVNVAGALACARAFARRRIARRAGGSIALVSSLATRGRPPEGLSAYTASKAALESLALSLAQELFPHGVAVNAVRLPPLATRMHAGAEGLPPPETVAPLFLWLASPEGRSCTGRIIDALAWQVDPFGAVALRSGLSPLVPARIAAREGLGESPLPPPRRVRRAVQRAASKQLRPYPDPRASALRRSLASRLGVPGDRIVFGAGALDLLQRALRCFCALGDEVIAGEPTFSLLGPLCAQEGLRLVRAPTLEDAAAAVSAATRLLYWLGPVEPGALERLRLPFGVPIVVDEAREPAAPLRYASDDRRPVILLRSFSKAYALAGVRLGYAVAPEETAGALERTQLPFHVSSLAQAAALAALRAGR